MAKKFEEDFLTKNTEICKNRPKSIPQESTEDKRSMPEKIAESSATKVKGLMVMEELAANQFCFPVFSTSKLVAA